MQRSSVISNPDTALHYARRAEYLAKINGYDSLQSQIFIALSSSHSFLANYDSSVTYSLHAIKVAEQFSDTIALIDGYNNLGIDFMFQEQDDKAISYLLVLRT